MATPTLDPKTIEKTSDTVQALIQLLRSRSSEEIRQRMYDNPPGSPWWAACKTELDLRNSERAATALVDTSRVLDKLRSATDHLDELTGRLLQSTTDMAELVKSVRESGRSCSTSLSNFQPNTSLRMWGGCSRPPPLTLTLRLVLTLIFRR